MDIPAVVNHHFRCEVSMLINKEKVPSRIHFKTTDDIHPAFIVCNIDVVKDMLPSL